MKEGMMSVKVWVCASLNHCIFIKQWKNKIVQRHFIAYPCAFWSGCALLWHMSLYGFIETRVLPIDFLPLFDSCSLEFDWSALLSSDALDGIEIQQATVKHRVCGLTCASSFTCCIVFLCDCLYWFVQIRLCASMLSAMYLFEMISVLSVCVSLTSLQPTDKALHLPIIQPQDSWVEWKNSKEIEKGNVEKCKI